MCCFYNVLFNLIKFVIFDLFKLVRFEIIDSINFLVICYCEVIKYDRLYDMFFQQFEFRKEIEGELWFGVIVCVYLDGVICEVGVYKLVFVFFILCKEKLVNCLMFLFFVVVKIEFIDLGDFCVVFFLICRNIILEVLCLF